MGDRDTRVVAYVTDEEAADLEQFADAAGKSVSQIVRQAILEYTDNDRAVRVEDKVDDLAAEIADLRAHLDDAEHTHTNTRGQQTTGSETVERTRTIAKRLHENYQTGATEAEVERAITDIAGGDPRTLDKYKSELKARGHAYEHPSQYKDTWFFDREPFLEQASEEAAKCPDSKGVARQLADPYDDVGWSDITDRLSEEVTTDG